MISYLLSKISRNTIYTQFTSKLIQLRLVEKKEVLSDEPIIAIKKKGNKSIVAAVEEASKSEHNKDPANIKLHNGFKHP